MEKLAEGFLDTYSDDFFWIFLSNVIRGSLIKLPNVFLIK